MEEMQYLETWFGSSQGLEGPRRAYYTCWLENLKQLVRSEIELSKEAKHSHGKDKQHVTAVSISNSITYYIPSKISDHFKNLVAIQIIRCDLRIISKDDLQPCFLLKELLLPYNNIESLPADLFDNTPLLEVLSFANNKIKFISTQTLTPLKSLKFADFRGNINIDVIYKSGEILPGGCLTLLSTLQAKIFLHCRPVDEQVVLTVSSYVHDLWQGEFSDFKIQARGEIFKVHKLILAANSPVFAAMFNDEMEENLKGEMAIEHFAPESIKEFLAFVYLREIPKTCFNAVDLFAMSIEYQVNELAAIIQWFIIGEVNVENASEMFKVGVQYDNKHIKEAAFQAIEKFFDKKLPEELMESVESMTEILEAKDKLNEILKRHLESTRQSEAIPQIKTCETKFETEDNIEGETKCKTEGETKCETECETKCETESESM